MKVLRQVVWTEGVMLGQQHFQYDRQQQQLHKQLEQRHLHEGSFGLAKLHIDDSQLALGRVVVQQLTALMPDGQWLVFDAEYDGPLEMILPQHDQGIIQLAVCFEQAQEINGVPGYPSQGTGFNGWQAEFHSISDQYDRERQREVMLARQILKLQPFEQWQHGQLPILSLQYQPKLMQWVVDERYIAPVLHISASANLTHWYHRFCGMLQHQVQLLTELRNQHRQLNHQFSYSDYVFAELLQRLCQYWSIVQSFEGRLQQHPVRLYERVIELLGSLRAFVDKPVEYQPLPRYDHRQLDAVFAALASSFTMLMETVTPSGTFRFPLTQSKAHHFVSPKLSADQLHHQQFCLAIYTEHLPQDVLQGMQNLVKIAAPSSLDKVVGSFTRGIALKHLSQPGQSLLAQRDCFYFQIVKEDPFWADILKEGQMAVFVSQDRLNYPIELVAYA